jgi:hypothetical protein
MRRLALASAIVLSCRPQPESTAATTMTARATPPKELLLGRGLVSSDGRFVVVSRVEGGASVYDARTWARLHDIDGHVRSLSADGRLAVTTGVEDAAVVEVWSLESGRSLLKDRLEVPCDDVVASARDALCVVVAASSWTWIPFSGEAHRSIDAIARAEVVALSAAGTYVAASVEPRNTVTEIVVREIATGAERRHPLPSLKRHHWAESVPEGDPVAIHELVVGDAGQVACASGEARVHLWSADGRELVFDEADHPLALEPGGAAVWAVGSRPKLGTLQRYGFDGAVTAAPGGPEPIVSLWGRSQIAFDGDDVFVLHSRGFARWSRSSKRWSEEHVDASAE